MSEQVFPLAPAESNGHSRVIPPGDDPTSSGELVDIGIGDDILVVDDRPANLVAVEAALAPLGRKLVFANSGAEALARLLDQDFALILLDVAMPGINGIETARLIRSRERSRGTPIVFVTGMAWQDEAIDEAYEAGGFDFLMKPVRPEVLRAKVRVFLKLQERTRALRRQAEELRASQAQLYEHQLHEQRKRFESELLETKLQQLAEGERRQHELAGLIGNELLNPLQTLQMAFDLLREHPYADKGERIYSLVEHRLVHVTRLVKILIDIAQVAAGQLQLSPRTVNIVEIVHGAITDCRAVIESRRLNARLDADTATWSILPLVIGDPVRLLQAFTTLIDHAARSTAEGGEIVVTAQMRSGDVVFTIADTGRGIAPELLPRVFDMFAGDGVAHGAGVSLGLPLVKRLIELHDGMIRVASRGVGQGATFEVRLPLAPLDVELSSLDVPASQDAEGTTIDAHAEPTQRMPVLELPPELSSDEPR
ncbi:MAG TPA: hybrid sensor histidine kinase/response regulator [Kofleriaceae bacterium]|nr:hybrid sensor histidine kinase/response regulator [Kofleriaceae bacterium]